LIWGCGVGGVGGVWWWVVCGSWCVWFWCLGVVVWVCVGLIWVVLLVGCVVFLWFVVLWVVVCGCFGCCCQPPPPAHPTPPDPPAPILSLLAARGVDRAYRGPLSSGSRKRRWLARLHGEPRPPRLSNSKKKKTKKTKNKKRAVISTSGQRAAFRRRCALPQRPGQAARTWWDNAPGRTPYNQRHDMTPSPSYSRSEGPCFIDSSQPCEGAYKFARSQFAAA